MESPFPVQLSHPRFPLAIRITLIILMLLCLLGSIAGLLSIMGIGGERISFGYFLGVIAGALMFYRLLRVYLWNAYGTEHLWLENNSLNYQPDFRHFKGNVEQLSIEGLAITVLDESEPKEPLGRLRFQNRETTLETVLKISLSEALETQTLLAEYLDRLRSDSN